MRSWENSNVNKQNDECALKIFAYCLHLCIIHMSFKFHTNNHSTVSFDELI